MKAKSRWGGSAALLACLVGFSAHAAPVVYGERASVKIRPGDRVGEGMDVSLVAARNEFVSFQVVVHGADTGAQGVRASLEGLSGPGRIGPESVTLYREAFLDVAKGSGGTKDLGPWPDPLIPERDEVAGEPRNAFPFDVPEDEARAVWVDLHVPAEAPPGTYRGEVKVSGSGLDARVPVRVDVVPAQLPSTSSLPTAFLLYPGNPCKVATGDPECGGDARKAAQVLEAYVRLALDHRVTLPNAFTVGRDGSDWAAFDAAHAEWMEGGLETRLAGARLTSAQITARRELPSFRAWAAHFRERGWLDRLYDYTGDEPPYGISFEEAARRAAWTREADPALRTLLTTTAQALSEYGLGSAIDLVVPVINHVDGTEAPYVGNQRAAYDAHLSRPGTGLWVYQSCMSQGCAFGTNAPENGDAGGWPSYMVDRSAARSRAMPWLAWKYDARGELYYETGLALTSAWTDQFRFNGNGDGTLFYPGTPDRIGGQTTVPLPSLRLKQIRLGQQDYEWLKLVADAGDPAFARRVVDELLPSASQVTDDGARFDQARSALVQRYLELTRAAVPPTLGNPTVAATGDGPAKAGGCSAAGWGSSWAWLGWMPGLALIVRAGRRVRRARRSA
ncbi:MAG: hypothetical protein RL653_3107 [Pseudomonadota bacterium]|jgi:hypothetical protein